MLLRLSILFSILVFISSGRECQSHPGIGIVKDSHGNIFYTDLFNVYRISDGVTTVAVRGVHTHELFMDSTDHLFGEHLSYDSRSDKFFHYLWRLSPEGKFDTIIDLRQAYLRHDFSLARDQAGNEYYFKIRDTNTIFKKTPSGRESVFATGEFQNTSWVHPQTDGSLLLVKGNSVMRIYPNGRTFTLARNIAGEKPRFAFANGGVILYGTWEDSSRNVYVAAFSDQAVMRILPDGSVTEVYRSEAHWAPVHGIFDKQGVLYLLESSDKNEMRVTRIEPRRN